MLSYDLRARTELLPSQEVWKARGGTLPRPWPAPEVTEIIPGFSNEGNGWTLTSCSVPHAQPALECMGFAARNAAKKFVYSGDAALCEPLAALTKDADFLLHWCYLLDEEPAHPAMVSLTPTPSQIAQMAKTAGVRRLLLSHFRIHMDSLAQHASALEILQGTFGAASGIAEDLDVYEI